MDYQREMISFIKPAQIIPGYGEVKVQQCLLVAFYSVLYTYMHVLSLLVRWHTYTVWPTQHFFLASMQLAQRIRGSCTEAIQHLLQACPQAETYGVGRQFAQSEEGRRKLIRGAWIHGFLERRMIHRAGVGLSKMNAMYTVHPVLCCEEFVCNPQPVLLPVLLENSKKPSSQASSNTTKAVVKQNGRGCRAKPMSTLRFQIQKSCLRLEAAMSTSFLVFFTVNTPKRLSYCPDITRLGLYITSKPKFMYYDIQFKQCKPRNPQKMLVMFTDTGDSLEVMYRITPCAGVMKITSTNSSISDC